MICISFSVGLNLFIDFPHRLVTGPLAGLRFVWWGAPMTLGLALLPDDLD